MSVARAIPDGDAAASDVTVTSQYSSELIGGGGVTSLGVKNAAVSRHHEHVTDCV